ncbi:DUF2716 domain-containing protein [Corallococcus sp. AB030]|nr:DUF2716 domain-containing protein [Corallococcus sp. CA041A]RKI20485.1 DUF2716 domain-containing protein [Corallococcus sp. AB030]RUO91659.1 DUF2716 domain-containing protein [Corallococcus sp. AB018]
MHSRRPPRDTGCGGPQRLSTSGPRRGGRRMPCIDPSRQVLARFLRCAHTLAFAKWGAGVVLELNLEAEAWMPLSGDAERHALDHSWPSSEEGCVRFVVGEDFFRLEHDVRLELYRELAERMLGVFRELTPLGGWLYALDPQHPCYRLHPHVRFETGATLEEMTGLYTREHMERVERGIHPPSFEPRWAMDVHPAGDPEHLFAPPDFHFVFAARYRVGNFDGLEAPGRGPIETETYELLGHRLIAAVERNPPALFQRARRLGPDD